MNKDELKSKIQNIGACEDMVQARTMLAELQTEILDDYESAEKVTSERDTLKESNESLRQANMKLFLQVGGKEEVKKEETPTKPKFEDLFDEKGGIK